MTGRRLAWGAIAVTVALAATGLALSAAAPPADGDDAESWLEISLQLVWLAYTVPGAVIVARLPRHPVGWLLVGVGVGTGLAFLAAGYATYALSADPDLPGAAVALWVPSTWWAPVLLVPMTFIPLLFPDGHLPGPRWRPWAWAAGLVVALACAGSLFAAGRLDEPPHLDNPFGVPAAETLQVVWVLMPLVLVLAAAAIVVRRRRATGAEREQLRWLTLATGVLLVSITSLVFLGDYGPIPAAVTLVPVAFLPVAITVAITRYRLYDIDLVINRTLLYGGLTAAVLGAYAVVVVAAGWVFDASVEWRQSVLVTVVIAMAAYPLRARLQRLVNRFMYGDRDDPYSAMSRLAQRLADVVTPATLLPTIAETVAQALRLPYVAVELAPRPGRAVASYGTPRGEPHRIPLAHQGEPVGSLVLGHRGPHERFSAADLQVFDDVARQVGVAAHAVLLAEELQRARERLVLTREEERRRLRRDLHDGLGSALAGMALYAGNARRALAGDGTGRRDPEAAAGWLARLEDSAGEAVTDVRRLVNDLRPPALDELGLVGALSAHAAGLPIAVDVLAPQALPPLSAAVEVAAYRIAMEAITNSVRHACASRCTVTVALEDALVVEVVDDGTGLTLPPRPGVGLVSMSERATELGGTCTVTKGDGGGTVVRATLPLPQPAEEP